MIVLTCFTSPGSFDHGVFWRIWSSTSLFILLLCYFDQIFGFSLFFGWKGGDDSSSNTNNTTTTTKTDLFLPFPPFSLSPLYTSASFQGDVRLLMLMVMFVVVCVCELFSRGQYRAYVPGPSLMTPNWKYSSSFYWKLLLECKREITPTYNMGACKGENSRGRNEFITEEKA